MRYLPVALLLAAFGCASDDASRPDASAAADTVAAPPTPVGDRVVVTDAFARAAPEGGNSALYARLINATSRPDTLVSAEVSLASRSELHETTDLGDGMRGMRELAGGVALPEGGWASLEPGGKHVMLLGLTGALTPSDTLAVTFVLASGERIEAAVPVR